MTNSILHQFFDSFFRKSQLLRLTWDKEREKQRLLFVQLKSFKKFSIFYNFVPISNSHVCLWWLALRRILKLTLAKSGIGVSLFIFDFLSPTLSAWITGETECDGRQILKCCSTKEHNLIININKQINMLRMKTTKEHNFETNKRFPMHFLFTFVAFFCFC